MLICVVVLYLENDQYSSGYNVCCWYDKPEQDFRLGQAKNFKNWFS